MKILMVCLGNICRSPVAEGVLRSKIEKYKLPVVIDSAGTSNYHLGECPDKRSMLCARKFGIDISDLRARQFVVEDFDRFDMILTMDTSNYNNVLKLARSQDDAKKVKPILEYSYPGKSMSVPDPYFGGEEGFNHVFRLLDEACDQIILELQQNVAKSKSL
jgi:protein-tyrosine phosphatase